MPASLSSTPPTCTAPFTNEELVGRAIKGRRDEVVLATKFGNVRGEDGARLGIDGRPEYVRSACDASLQRLGRRRDRPLLPAPRRRRASRSRRRSARWPSSCRPARCGTSACPRRRRETVRRAFAVHPITALQTEYSLWSRDPEDDGVLATMRELGVGFVAYSPLGRGFLTGPDPQRRRPRAPTISAGTHRGSRATTSPATCSSSIRCSEIADGEGRHARPSSRWPGCSRRATTSCRFPAPSGAPTWRRTSPRWTSS